MRSWAVAGCALLSTLLVAAPVAAGAPGALRPLPGKAGCIAERHSGTKSCAVGRALDDLRAIALDPTGRGVYTAAFQNGISHIVRGPRGRLGVPAGRDGCVAGRNADNHDGCTVVPDLDDPEGLALSPDGTQLYAGVSNINAVLGFARSRAGALAPLSPPGGCVGKPAAAPEAPAAPGCTPLSVLELSKGVVVSSDGRFVYVAARDAVVGLARDPATGDLTPLPTPGGCVQQAPAPDGCTPGRGLTDAQSLTLTADGRFLYSESGKGAAVLARDPATGTITQPAGPEGCVQAGGAEGCTAARTGTSPFGSNGVILSPDDRNLYEAFDGGVATFARDPQSGGLTQLPGTKGCLTRGGKNGCARYRGITQAFSLAVSPNGASVYLSGVHEAGANTLLAFSRSPGDGSLQQLQGRAGCYVDRASVARREGCSAVRVAAENGLMVSSNGRLVYGIADAVSVFARRT
jgi:hypothetical protein